MEQVDVSLLLPSILSKLFSQKGKFALGKRGLLSHGVSILSVLADCTCASCPCLIWAQITWLRRELMAMETRQRRAFVKFVTASVCMPSEGNPIVVNPQVTTRQEGADGDSKLPTSRTCTNVLYLPAYSSVSLLKRRLGQAIWEEHIEFD